ncbi:MAG: gliding motility-associated C-terminal domain-containing protein [Flavobacteriales bacterium]|nr:gliding motility-associated C-terminal domain-containing protein [Flavobacteriales bacterium]
MLRVFRYWLFLLAIAMPTIASATHNRAAEIIYCVDANNPLLYHIQIITYTRTSAPADRPDLGIEWGDGGVDSLARVQIDLLPNDAQRNLYLGDHLYAGPGVYTLVMEDPNRNEGVVNIPNSVNVPLCVKTVLVISPATGGNCSARFLNPPLQDACYQLPWVHNPAAYDPDGDSLSYQLSVCAGGGCAPIGNYSYPDQIVPGANNQFAMDPTTGTISWDSPQLVGEYNVAFIVKEWRKVNGTWVNVGLVTRDMQITVKPGCNDQPPVVAELQDTCVVAGTNLVIPVHASDPDAADELTLQALGEPLVLSTSPAVFSAGPPNNPVTGTFGWSTTCDHVRLQPYQMIFRATDDAQLVQLDDYESVSIRVVAPAPENPSATPQVNAIDLAWDPSICTNAGGYRIYRRVNSYGFMPSHCETGVPGYTGYSLLASSNGVNNSSYLDTDVQFGVQYCYMVTAYFDDGGESYASEEFCAFLERKVPLLTNVSVINTDAVNGADTVIWTNAVDLDTVMHPGPYQFKLYRGDGYAIATTPVWTSSLFPYLVHPDTVHVDAGIDTRNGPHVYRVELFGDDGATLIGSSNPASSVYLAAAPNDEQITLTWTASTPWTNTDFVIYRHDGSDFVPIATSTEPLYVDTGLVNGQEYCYKVSTIGAYGDPSVVSPLINFSQEVCSSPLDLTPPCPPMLTIDNDCQALSNTLTWNDPNNSCADDTWYYNIFFTDSLGGPYLLVGTNYGHADTSFVHNDDGSVAGCYVITAVDSMGNESDYSNQVCGDNCPEYMLPNVFTPNGDLHNDAFMPFPYRGVDHIDLTIYDRWGQVVFTTDDPDIQWKGERQGGGGAVSDGVYFYTCIVHFKRLDGIEVRQLTGYVHLLRGGSTNVN